MAKRTQPFSEMTAPDSGAEALYRRQAGAVAFRLFADGSRPTLTVPEQIAARIGDRIISGALVPGDRIVEQDLAAEFAVSRGPVRDAIRVLEREGLVTVLARRGAIVTDLSAEEVRHIFEVRAGLFSVVARKVALARDPDLLAVLEAGVARLNRLANMKDDQGAYAETSYRLSILSARSCGNELLARMLFALSLQTLRYSKLSLKSMARRRQSARIWHDAFAALSRGDVEGYVELARRRVEESGAEAVRQLTPATASRQAGRSKAPRAAA
jgi:DNA-binding GntR family transcriptional regulator